MQNFCFIYIHHLLWFFILQKTGKGCELTGKGATSPLEQWARQMAIEGLNSVLSAAILLFVCKMPLPIVVTDCNGLLMAQTNTKIKHPVQTAYTEPIT